MAPSNKYLSSSIFYIRPFSIFRSFSAFFASPVERRPAKVLSSIRGRLCLGSNQDEEKTWKRKVGTSPTLSLSLSHLSFSHSLSHLPTHALSFICPRTLSPSLCVYHAVSLSFFIILSFLRCVCCSPLSFSWLDRLPLPSYFIIYFSHFPFSVSNIFLPDYFSTFCSFCCKLCFLLSQHFRQRPFVREDVFHSRYLSLSSFSISFSFRVLCDYPCLDRFFGVARL